MIKYIQNKKINYELMQELLTTSTNLNHFTNEGPAKSALENHLKSMLKLPNHKAVVCSASGTSALHALVLFFKKRGVKKFTTPSYTFPSCVVGGLKTKVMDISLENYCFIDLDRAIESNDCLIITNLFGTYPKNLNEILNRCKENDTKVILDNASSPMTTVEGININCFGDASFGSLHHTKYLGFGEGGFLVIDAEHKEEINQILGFGFDATSKKRISNVDSSNFKISDVSSAAILQHIMDYDLEAHKNNQDYFISIIIDINNVKIFNFSEGVVYGNMPIINKNPMSIDFFINNHLEAKKYYYPLKRHKNSMYLYERIINLPLHAKMSRFEIDKIARIVRLSVNE